MYRAVSKACPSQGGAICPTHTSLSQRCIRPAIIKPIEILKPTQTSACTTKRLRTHISALLSNGQLQLEIQMRQRKILFKVLKLFEILQKSNFNCSDHLSKQSTSLCKFTTANIPPYN